MCLCNLKFLRIRVLAISAVVKAVTYTLLFFSALSIYTQTTLIGLDSAVFMAYHSSEATNNHTIVVVCHVVELLQYLLHFVVSLATANKVRGWNIAVVWHECYRQVVVIAPHERHLKADVVVGAGQIDISIATADGDFPIHSWRNSDDVSESITSRTIEIAYCEEQFLEWLIGVWWEDEYSTCLVHSYKLLGLVLVSIMNKQGIDCWRLQDCWIEGDIDKVIVEGFEKCSVSITQRWGQLYEVNLWFGVVVVFNCDDEWLCVAVLVHWCSVSMEGYVDLWLVNTFVCLQYVSMADYLTFILAQV